eukprot:comp11832_c1_seq1/m.6461 comp11832_c1_seq1/g.6461  ORF comp11832_c1_seq1/g.6461 comp11832_c1_seq1/m.6461 type:complete len:323 (-) comp11832_c1_seq1:644-1612(-)
MSPPDRASEPATVEEDAAQPRALLHILSGAGAGAVSSVLTCPLDVIKTRMQNQGPVHPDPYKGIRDGMHKIYKSEGVRGFYRGLGPNLVALLPTWAVYFTAYETYKEILCEHFDLPRTSSRLHLVSAMLAGCASTFATAPLWLIKTRLVTQARGITDHYYHNSFDAFVTIVRREGPKGLYKGLSASLLGTVHVGIQFPLYEKLKHTFKPRGDPNAEVSTAGIMAASSISKVIASVAWYPHEVVRTRMQSQSVGPIKYRSILHCFRTILVNEGIRALYRGMGTNLCRVVPSCAITFTSYETLLNVLIEWDPALNFHRGHPAPS